MQPTFLWAARDGAPRADLCERQHFAQKSAQNFVDYYLLTFPDKCGIIYMSRGSGEIDTETSLPSRQQVVTDTVDSLSPH